MQKDRSEGRFEHETAEAAIQRLIDEHGGLLYALGLRFCGNGADAEDLVQEVFLNALRGWDDFEGRSSPKTWLYTIATRVCQRMRRKRAGEPKRIESLERLLPFDGRPIAVVPDERDDAARQLVRREARERVEAAITRLPAEFRVPLILKEIVGFTIPEISSILGLEEGTVRSRVHRARLKLRTALDAVLPRDAGDTPPPAYSVQTCLDLLEAKQQALDRGVAFDTDVICARCRSVFAALDLTRDVCSDLAEDRLPANVRERLADVLAAGDQPARP